MHENKNSLQYKYLLKTHQYVTSQKASLGAKLMETQAFYAAHLSGYQLQVRLDELSEIN